MSKGKRRSNNEGSISELSDGTWRGYVHLGIKANGNPDRKYFRGQTWKECNIERKRLLRLIEARLPVKAQKLTVAEYLNDWLETEVKQTTAPRTYDSYKDTCRLYIIPTLGPVQLSKLEGRQIRAMETALLGRQVKQTDRLMSASTVRYCHRVLKRALSRAVVNGLIMRNPMDVVLPPKPRKEEAKYLTLEEVHTLLAHVRGTRLDALLTLAVTVGMRQGEILGLRWECVELDRGTLHVVRTIGKTSGELQFGPTKSKSGVRSIVLPASTLASLRAHRLRQVEQKWARGARWQDMDLVFPNIYGGMYAPRNLIRDFHKAREAAGIREINFHALRHTAASLMLAQGIPLHVVSRILGHSSISITADLYGHLYDPTKQLAAESMDILFSGVGA